MTDAKAVVSEAVRNRTWSDETTIALQQFIDATNATISPYRSAANVPTGLVSNTRNDMYLAGEALKLIDKKQVLPMDAADLKSIKTYHQAIDNATKFIPTWVKVAVALALGLGTMVGWKRIVVTVGEKIGKSHLTYGQGASAELVAMGTIFTADSSACRSAPRISFLRALRERWSPTARACRCRPCAICSWPGY